MFMYHSLNTSSRGNLDRYKPANFPHKEDIRLTLPLVHFTEQAKLLFEPSGKFYLQNFKHK